MQLTHVVHAVEAHAEGEPTRVVVGGVLNIPGETMFDKKMYLQREGDSLRQFLLFEPRGYAVLSAVLVQPSVNPEAAAGFIIMESTDYPPMSGTNTINTTTVLLETGMIPMEEPTTRFTLESPAGLVAIEAECKDGKCVRVRFTSVPAFATHLDAPIEVPGIGTVKVDVAYGGAFFAITDAQALGMDVTPEYASDLARVGQIIKAAAAEQLPVVHPANPDIHTVTFTTWTAPPRAGGDGRNATIVSPGRIDRSACGTATCARMAVLAAKGQLGYGQAYVHESILSTNFIGGIERSPDVGGYAAVVPSISGRSWIIGFHQLGHDPSDPLSGGFTLGDTWGIGEVSDPAAVSPRASAAGVSAGQ